MSSYPKFANFGEYLFYAYANVQMLFLAVKSGIPKYKRLNGQTFRGDGCNGLAI